MAGLRAGQRQVVADAYPLRRTPRPAVTIAAMGAVVTEALAAADRLTAADTPADVLCVTSPGLLFDALRTRQGSSAGSTWIQDQVLPGNRATPLVTVLGSVEDVYRYHGIDADSIVRAGLAAAGR